MVVDFDITLCNIDLVAKLLTISCTPSGTYHHGLILSVPIVLRTGGFLESTPKHTRGKYREKGRSEDEETFESTIGSTFFD